MEAPSDNQESTTGEHLLFPMDFPISEAAESRERKESENKKEVKRRSRWSREAVPYDLVRRDKKIIEYVDKYPLVDAEQLAELVGCSVRAVKRRLTKLFHNKVVDKEDSLKVSNRLDWYRAMRRGRKEAVEQLAHTRGVTKSVSRFELQLRKIGLSLERDVDWVIDGVETDFEIKVWDEKNEFKFAWEWDEADNEGKKGNSLADELKKMEAYQRYYGRTREEFWVLYVVQSERRRDRLIELARGQLFWFTVWTEDIDFLDEVWMSGDRRVGKILE